MPNAIETSELVKTFGATRALDGVDLSIRGGTVYGLLGPTGAGKTTTIRVLTTLLRPTRGKASVLGHDVVREAAAVRQKVSLTGQYASVDEDLTGHENLILIGRLLGLSWTDARKRATELLAAFGLSDAAGRLVRTFSGGMRRRIDIAASLVARPEILFGGRRRARRADACRNPVHRFLAGRAEPRRRLLRSDWTPGRGEGRGRRGGGPDVSPDSIVPRSGTLVMEARPKPASTLSAIGTLAWRAMLKIKHVPFQLFDVTIMPIMFTLLFVYMFGGALAGSPRAYVQFLLPGILVQTILFITVYTGVGINTDIQKGLYDRFRSLPMWQPAPIIGALAGDLFRYSVAFMLIIVLGLILGFRPAGGAVGVFLAFGLVLVFSFALSWIWIIFGMMVKTPESVMTTSFVFLMPLTFASNIFVGLETMPSWLQAVVRHNPVTHLSSASRGLMHGDDVGPDVLWVLAAAAVITLVAAPVALRMYHQER